MARPLTLEDRLVRARTQLLSRHYYYGALAMRLFFNEDPTLKPPTMCTDGSQVRYHPEWTSKLSDGALRFVFAHETLHCVLKHPYRRGGRDPQRWNVACDYQINATLCDAGMREDMPADALYDDCYRDPATGYPLAAEIIYARLPQDVPDPSGSTGTMEDAPEPTPQEPDQEPDPDAPRQMTESAWDIESIAAQAATDAGHLAAGTKRAIEQARKPRQSLEEHVRDFLTNTVPSGFTWARPNRRYRCDPFVLPTTKRENYPPFAVCIDTSGSVSQEDLDYFSGILDRFVQEVRPEYVKVVYCDAEVQAVDTFTPDEPITLEAAGGGGTDFQPALDLVTQAIEDGEPIAATLYITDLYANEPQEPDYPVLWVVSPGSSVPAGPFGTSVRLDPYES